MEGIAFKKVFDNLGSQVSFSGIRCTIPSEQLELESHLACLILGRLNGWASEKALEDNDYSS